MNPLYLIPITLGIFSIGVMIYAGNNLYELHTGIVEDLNERDEYSDLLDKLWGNDLNCHKIGLYTSWDEELTGGFSKYISGVDVGKEARKLFFENDCNTLCYVYWTSEKLCLEELYK